MCRIQGGKDHQIAAKTTAVSIFTKTTNLYQASHIDDPFMSFPQRRGATFSQTSDLASIQPVRN